MKHYIQKKPQCLLYAFAMAIQIPPEILIKEIGHEGKHGFHPQELIDCCHRRNYYVMQIDAIPVIQHNELVKRVLTSEQSEKRLSDYIQNYSGVLTDSIHAVYWSNTDCKIYDPKGTTYGIESFNIKYFFIVDSIK